MREERRLTRGAVAVALIICSCKKAPPSPPRPDLTSEQKQKIAKLVDEAKAQAKDLDDTRHAVVTASKLEPSASPCPYNGRKLLPEPLPPDATNNAKIAFSANLLSTTMTVADVVDPDGKPQNSLHPAQSALEKALKPHDALITSGQFYETPEKAVDALETAISKWRDSGDGFLVIKQRIDAELSGTSITPGRVVGRFYFVLRKDKRVACLVDVDVTGPRGFTAWGETQADLGGNAASQLPHRLTGEAVIEGLVNMRLAK